MKKINLLFFFFINLVLLQGCKDDDIMGSLTEEDFNVDKNEYAISFLVTLDRLGGATGTRSGNFNPMEDIESYIDPEKFRVLFFDSKEQFLFESKSRWVKRESEDAESTTWYVSVPLYNYGNDNKYNWEFDKIRNILTSESFQIVLMVNRPLYEYASEYKTADGSGSDGGQQNGWFDNSKPDWKKEDSLFPENGVVNPNPKTIFDIHHSQEDWVYENKSAVSGLGSGSNTPAEGYYNFIMAEPSRQNIVKDNQGKITQNVMANTIMSSVTSWVDWDGEEQAGDNKNKKNYHVINNSSVYKKILHPNKNHPIPMYGTQKFQSIDPKTWTIGTTFNLTRPNIDLPVSLLRSCVKLELVMPSEPDFVTIWYSNIYSRCEPMDIWTPTNEIWCKGSENNVCSEMDAIMDNGPVFNNSALKGGDPLTEYQYKISWFYGRWLDKGWQFGSLGRSNVKPAGHSYGYPRIFNPMIQRNTTVSYGDNPYFKNGNQYHAIIYTGERNVNDPSNLSKSYDTGTSTTSASGSRMIEVLVFKLKNSTKVYSVPITNYDYSTSHPARSIGTATYSDNAALARGDIDNYAFTVSQNSTNKNYRPWPLMRNHVYRLYMQNTSPGTKSGDDGEYIFSSEQSSSKTITFPKVMERFNRSRGIKDTQKATLDVSKLTDEN